MFLLLGSLFLFISENYNTALFILLLFINLSKVFWSRYIWISNWNSDVNGVEYLLKLLVFPIFLFFRGSYVGFSKDKLNVSKPIAVFLCRVIQWVPTRVIKLGPIKATNYYCFEKFTITFLGIGGRWSRFVNIPALIW